MGLLEILGIRKEQNVPMHIYGTYVDKNSDFVTYNNDLFSETKSNNEQIPLYLLSGNAQNIENYLDKKEALHTEIIDMSDIWSVSTLVYSYKHKRLSGKGETKITVPRYPSIIHNFNL